MVKQRCTFAISGKNALLGHFSLELIFFAAFFPHTQSHLEFLPDFLWLGLTDESHQSFYVSSLRLGLEAQPFFFIYEEADIFPRIIKCTFFDFYNLLCKVVWGRHEILTCLLSVTGSLATSFSGR